MWLKHLRPGLNRKHTGEKTGTMLEILKDTARKEVWFIFKGVCCEGYTSTWASIKPGIQCWFLSMNWFKLHSANNIHTQLMKSVQMVKMFDFPGDILFCKKVMLFTSKVYIGLMVLHSAVDTQKLRDVVWRTKNKTQLMYERGSTPAIFLNPANHYTLSRCVNDRL